jgi:hypothetical protein
MGFEKLKDIYLQQINDALNVYQQIRGLSERGDSDTSKIATNKFITISFATIERISGKNSIYFHQADAVLKKYGTDNHYNIPIMAGILEALKNDLTKDHLVTIIELVHSELFSDFLEMAEYLLQTGYKDAAAVIAGSSLEAYLRQLCNKYGIPVEKETENGFRPKKADELNTELSKKEVYSKSDQKSVTAWLSLRNSAAHGKYHDYSIEQVALLISSIREIMNRISA